MKYYTVKEASNILGVTEATVRSYIILGKWNLKATKIGSKYLIKEQDISKFIDKPIENKAN